MAAANDARVDTTFIGYLLIGFFLLVYGVYRLQIGGLFGDNYNDQPIDEKVIQQIMFVIGLLMILLTILAYRTGKKTTAAIFAFSGLYLFFLYYNLAAKTAIVSTANSDWFLSVAFAIFFVIFAIYALVDKAPKFAALFLLLMALLAFFQGLSGFYGTFGVNDMDICNALRIVSAIFAFLGFIITTYLGLAYADPKKIPLI